MAWILWMVLVNIAAMTTWQVPIARVLSSKNAKAAKQAYRRSAFCYVGNWALPGLWAAAAYLYFCGQGGLPEGVGAMAAMPEYLRIVLPSGILGLVLAAMLAAEMSSDSAYLLTWATIIYNDLILPCRRKPMSPRAKLLTVRISVVLIGIFLVFFGLVYELPGTAWDFLAVTGTIYFSSMFALLVGALYWPWTNRTGAYSAIALGVIGPLTFPYCQRSGQGRGDPGGSRRAVGFRAWLCRANRRFAARQALHRYRNG